MCMFIKFDLKLFTNKPVFVGNKKSHVYEISIICFYKFANIRKEFISENQFIYLLELILI